MQRKGPPFPGLFAVLDVSAKILANISPVRPQNGAVSRFGVNFTISSPTREYFTISLTVGSTSGATNRQAHPYPTRPVTAPPKGVCQRRYAGMPRSILSTSSRCSLSARIWLRQNSSSAMSSAASPSKSRYALRLARSKTLLSSSIARKL